ncbi:hypothetical protein AB0P17_02320 [Streptomyces sp. NPDC088124]|uniref:hypothetical protein n=1 Tax=Streptomyces sp. NPDC088124 TaxID=3154654 RepID=UPI00342A07EE
MPRHTTALSRGTLALLAGSTALLALTTPAGDTAAPKPGRDRGTSAVRVGGQAARDGLVERSVGRDRSDRSDRVEHVQEGDGTERDARILRVD